MGLEFVCFFVTTNGCIKTRYVYGSINELKTVVVVIVVVCFLMADHVSIKMHGSLFWWFTQEGCGSGVCKIFTKCTKRFNCQSEKHADNYLHGFSQILL